MYLLQLPSQMLNLARCLPCGGLLGMPRLLRVVVLLVEREDALA